MTNLSQVSETFSVVKWKSKSLKFPQSRSVGMVVHPTQVALLWLFRGVPSTNGDTSLGIALMHVTCSSLGTCCSSPGKLAVRLQLLTAEVSCPSRQTIACHFTSLSLRPHFCPSLPPHPLCGPHLACDSHSHILHLDKLSLQTQPTWRGCTPMAPSSAVAHLLPLVLRWKSDTITVDGVCHWARPCI